MLTPAEELGLSGLALASRVRKAFYQIPESQIAELVQRIRDESFRQHLIYLRDGELDTIRVLPCPITAFGGADDKRIGREQLERWSAETTSRFQLHLLPGSHFFLNNSREELLSVIRSHLDG